MWRVLRFHEPALVPNTLQNGYPIFSLFPGDYLANRFYVAVRLFINRSEMMSKCGKDKNLAHGPIAECVTDVLTTF